MASTKDKKARDDNMEEAIEPSKAYQLEKKELNRLRRLYKKLPPNKYALVQGLIQEAARLRARCDVLWDDLQENGEVEMFSQSDDVDPYERERPASRIYTAANKAYQTIIKQLDAMLPAEAEKSDAFVVD